jgi:spore coat protein JB
MKKQSEEQSVKLLEQLQAIDYALAELKLFLEEYPNDIYAMQQNIALFEKREVIRKELHQQISSISSYGIMSDPDNRKWSLAR